MPRPRSMIETFYVSTLDKPTPWATILLALTAATARSLELYGAGYTWSVGNTMVQHEDKAAGVFIGIMDVTSPPAPPATPSSETIPYDSLWWKGPPSVVAGPQGS